MEEKKLTDEEVVKALDICTTADDDTDCSDGCPMYDENYCTAKLMRYACDLIHRLQAENETLKSKKFGMWKVKFFNLKEKFDQELAEHNEFVKNASEKIWNMQAVIYGLEEEKKQVAKDTAKEIFETIFGYGWAIKDENGKRIFVESVLKNIAKERYDVEVE